MYMKNLFSLVSLAGILFCASWSNADMLELRDGRIVEGTFMGASQNSVRFLVDETVELFGVGDIWVVTFDVRGDSADAPEVVAPVTSPEPVTLPEPEPAAPLPTHRVLIPAGTPMLVRIVDPIDSRQHGVGYRFAAALEADLAYNGEVVAPRGSQLYGVISSAKQAGRLKGKTHLTLEMRDIRIDNRMYPILTSDYELAGKKSSGKRTVLQTLAGAALGAAIDSHDRGEGALIGAGVGLGASAITKGERLSIPAGTLIEFRLGAPFFL